MNDNDLEGQQRRPFGDPADSPMTPGIAIAGLIAFGLVLLLLAWPGERNAQVSENTPAYRAPTTAPVTPSDPKPIVPK
jgi:hypothetical protein